MCAEGITRTIRRVPLLKWALLIRLLMCRSLFKAFVDGAHDRCRTPVRKPIGKTALVSGVWVRGPYASLHHGQVRRRGIDLWTEVGCL